MSKKAVKDFLITHDRKTLLRNVGKGEIKVAEYTNYIKSVETLFVLKTVKSLTFLLKYKYFSTKGVKEFTDAGLIDSEALFRAYLGNKAVKNTVPKWVVDLYIKDVFEDLHETYNWGLGTKLYNSFKLLVESDVNFNYKNLPEDSLKMLIKYVNEDSDDVYHDWFISETTYVDDFFINTFVNQLSILSLSLNNYITIDIVKNHLDLKWDWLYLFNSKNIDLLGNYEWLVTNTTGNSQANLKMYCKILNETGKLTPSDYALNVTFD